jgi:hypothetical protein
MKSPIILLIALLSFTLSCSPNTGSTASPRPAAPTQAQLLEKEQPSSDAQAKKVSLSEEWSSFFVRFVIVGLPVFLFLGVPFALLLRYLVRRAKRVRLAQALATSAPE